MGWSGGIYTRARDFTDDEANEIKMLSANFDEEHDSIETGLNNCITKDGTNVPSANMPMASKRHTNCDGAVERNEYATLGQVQDGYGKSATTGGTSTAYTLTLAPTLSAYADGLIVVFKAHISCAGNSTLDVDSLGAKTIYMNLSTLEANDITLNRTYVAVYFSTGFHLFSQVQAAATPQYKIRRDYFNGNGTWTCPTGVTRAIVQCWGGGGGAGQSYGGQGGCYAESELTVVPSTGYDIVIGAGGNAGIVGVNGTYGGDTTFDATTIIAKGGAANGSSVITGSVGELKVYGGTGLNYTKDMDSENEGYFGGIGHLFPPNHNMFIIALNYAAGGDTQRAPTIAYYPGLSGLCIITYVELV